MSERLDYLEQHLAETANQELLSIIQTEVFKLKATEMRILMRMPREPDEASLLRLASVSEAASRAESALADLKIQQAFFLLKALEAEAIALRHHHSSVRRQLQGMRQASEDSKLIASEPDLQPSWVTWNDRAAVIRQYLLTEDAEDFRASMVDDED